MQDRDPNSAHEERSAEDTHSDHSMSQWCEYSVVEESPDVSAQYLFLNNAAWSPERWNPKQQRFGFVRAKRIGAEMSLSENIELI